MKVFEARTTAKVSECEKLDIYNKLAAIYVRLGLKGQNLPDKYETVMFMDYIRENLSEFTLAEIELAFNFYIANKLDFKDPLFQNFTLNFLENVMQSYKRLRATTPHPDVKPLPEKTKPTAQEIDLIERNAALKKFQEYKDHMDLWDFGGATFAFLWRLGLIRLTEEEREQLKLKAERELIREAQMEIKNGKRPSEIATVVEAIQAGNDNQVRLRMRKLALMDYFETLIAQGVELKEVLK